MSDPEWHKGAIKKNWGVDQNSMDQIRKQVEYYFSLANLITDHYLRRLMSENKKGWVHISEVVGFRKLREQLLQALPGNVSRRMAVELVVQSLKNSEILQVSHRRVKIKRRMIWQRQTRKVLYFQGKGLKEQNILNILSLHNANNHMSTIRTGQNWIIVSFDKSSSEEISLLFENIKQYLLINQPFIKLLNMEQFQHFDDQFRKIFQNPKRPKNIKIQTLVPSGRMIDSNDVIMKEKKKDDLLQAEKNKINYEKYFSKYIKSRNQRTPQAYQQHRTKKIAQKRQRKLQKQHQMQIQKPQLPIN